VKLITLPYLSQETRNQWVSGCKPPPLERGNSRLCPAPSDVTPVTCLLFPEVFTPHRLCREPTHGFPRTWSTAWRSDDGLGSDAEPGGGVSRFASRPPDSIYRSVDRSVGIATGRGLEGFTSAPVAGKTSLHSFLTGSEAHAISLAHIRCRGQEWGELYLHFPHVFMAVHN
jgi:hypothetical protein